MKSFQTPQEEFWFNNFGDDYTDRNNENRMIRTRIALFTKIFSRTVGIKSVLELGTNIGQNLIAIQTLLNPIKLTGVEINKKAFDIMSKISNVNAIHGSILELKHKDLGKHDLTFTSGVLIHINPDSLPKVYERLYHCTKKYILIIEYYNPTPVVINYRNNTDKLFKRDFAGELMDLHKDLELVDYGFQYHRDNNFAADDATWFLMKKS